MSARASPAAAARCRPRRLTSNTRPRAAPPLCRAQALETALDSLLDDDELVDAIADEALFREYADNMEAAGDALDAARDGMASEAAAMRDNATSALRSR